MAYGLKIDNGSGQRVLDSDYNGVYYLGKASTSTPGAVQVPGYTGTIAPLVFVKYPTAAGEFAQITKLESSSGTAPGGLATATLTVPSNVIYAHWGGGATGSNQSTSESLCSTVGGTWVSGNPDPIKCIRTTPLTVSTDTYTRGDATAFGTGSASGKKIFLSEPSNSQYVDFNDGTSRWWQQNSKSADVTLTFNSSGVPNTSVTIPTPGYGWTVNDTEYLGNNSHYTLSQNPDSDHFPNEGWHPYNTSSNVWYTQTTGVDTSVLPYITANSLSSGWNATLSGEFTTPVTCYFFGLGGETPPANTFGLSLYNGSGDTTFSTTRPPPVIKNVQNISFTDIDYNDGTQVDSNETPVNSSSGSLVTADTAMSSLPVAPSSFGGVQQITTSGHPSNPFPPIWILGMWGATAQSGFNFKDSGGNLSKITFISASGSPTTQIGTDVNCKNVPTNNTSIPYRSPVWTITSGTTGGGGVTVNQCNQTYYNAGVIDISPSWSINHDCLFLDTSIYDDLSY